MRKDTRKLVQALTYLASRQPNGSLEKMKGFKLLWLADRYHLRAHGRTISGDSYFAMPRGLVPSDAKNLLEGQPTLLDNDPDYFDSFLHIDDNYNYSAASAPDLNELSESDVKAMDLVLEIYGHMDRHQLSSLSHKYPEWKKYEFMLRDRKKKNSFPVNMDLMFENCDDDDSALFAQSPEHLFLTKEIYHELKR